VYYVLILAVGIERLVELVVSKRNAAWAFARGGKEYGREHYPVMVIIHAGLLIGCVVEVWLADRPFIPWLGWSMFVIAVLTQVLRWWCITTLGKRWNTLVIVLPDAPLVSTGPYKYKWLHHPNYLVVVIEGIALPMIHTAWITAICFTVANALLLRVRLRVENEALGYTQPAANR
jgi:methyltransferase